MILASTVAKGRLMTYGIDKEALFSSHEDYCARQLESLRKMLEDDKNKHFSPLLPPIDVHVVNVRVIREEVRDPMPKGQGLAVIRSSGYCRFHLTRLSFETGATLEAKLGTRGCVPAPCSTVAD